jgi:ribose 5-phosphate isomerase A
MATLEDFKRQAAEAALAQVTSGMRVGLGTGSTAIYFTRALAAALADGSLRDVVGVPTSEATAAAARALGIPLVELPRDGVDVTVDGMDELDPHLDAIKGLGGALTREKVVAESSRVYVLVSDASKRVTRLGERAPVPVEVLRFGAERTAERIRALSPRANWRLVGGERFVTDNGQWVLDAELPPGQGAAAFARELDRLAGVLAHGLFLHLTSFAFIADAQGVSALRRAP